MITGIVTEDSGASVPMLVTSAVKTRSGGPWGRFSTTFCTAIRPWLVIV